MSVSNQNKGVEVSQMKDVKRITKLAIFDFDSTIFKSPLPNPEIWTDSFLGTIVSDCQWFCDIRTLSAPFVPQSPSDEWYHLEIVNIAKEYIQRNDILVVLLTGRRQYFRERVVQLCNNIGLHFDFYYLKPCPDANCTIQTLDFKLSVIESLLQQYDCIQSAELYDDRAKHVSRFELWFDEQKKIGRLKDFKTVLVKIPEFSSMFIDKTLEKELVLDMVRVCNDRIKCYRDQASQDNEQSNNGRRVSISKFRNEIVLIEHVYYTGIILDTASVDLICHTFVCPKGWKPKYHHMTVSFGGINTEMVQKLGGLGSEHELIVTHVGTLEGLVSALKVDKIARGGYELQSENETFHITLFISPSGTSKLANSIADWVPLDTPLRLSGSLQAMFKVGPQKKVNVQEEKKDVSIGTLVKAKFTKLEGKEIGKVVKFVQEWMDKACIENSEANRAVIEWKLQNLELSEVK